MNDSNSKNISQTDWERINAMNDEAIDTSEIPPLSDSFFERATLRVPKDSVTVTVVIDSDILRWYRSQGADYENRMSAALKIYAEAHRSPESQ
jgi:uncharacterized protein (DUF4415 family)